jgi:aryl sulfotransferase
MLTYTDEEMFRLLEEQRHRRFIKTRTPLDGVPRLPSVTYTTVIRHPLDTALSYRDHEENLDSERLVALRAAASGPMTARMVRSVTRSRAGNQSDILRTSRKRRTRTFAGSSTTTENPTAVVPMAWPTTASRSGRTGMPGESRTCICSTTPICGTSGRARCDGWPPRSASRSLRSDGQPFVEAAGLDSMRSRADDTVPENQAGIWRSPAHFFREGGTRDWASLLDSRDLTHFNERLRDLAGEASDWVLRGRVALEEDLSHSG